MLVVIWSGYLVKIVLLAFRVLMIMFQVIIVEIIFNILITIIYSRYGYFTTYFEQNVILDVNWKLSLVFGCMDVVTSKILF